MATNREIAREQIRQSVLRQCDYYEAAFVLMEFSRPRKEDLVVYRGPFRVDYEMSGDWSIGDDSDE